MTRIVCGGEGSYREVMWTIEVIARTKKRERREKWSNLMKKEENLPLSKRGR